VKRFTALLALVLLFTGVTALVEQHGPNASASSVGPTTTCASAIDWSKAKRVVGRSATIKGPVAGTRYASSSTGSPTFLNIGVDFPNPQRFTIVIWGRNRGRFGTPEMRYRGHTVCVRGYIDTFRGVAEVEARSPSQIVVVR
jgi:DNA/RNA endonuclease YhcR with UshA esterase domain